MKSQTISLCMIVKNEERALGRCLESVKEIVDEIIIVDTGSNDKTLEIARQYTSKIYTFEWNDNFSDARNFAVQFATSDYILSLDADEYLDPESKHLLLEPLTADFFFLRIRNRIRSGVVDTHSFIRLYSRHKGFVYKGAIHEQINFPDFPESSPGALSVYIIHDGYEKTIITNKDKHNRNMKIIEDELKREPTAFGYFNLGNQYKSIGEMDNAVKAYSKAYSLDSKKSFIPKLIIYLAQALVSLKQYNEAQKILEDFIQLHPVYTDLHYELGVLYSEIDYWKDAEAAFHKCLTLGEVTNHMYSSMEGVGSYLAHAYLSELYLKWNKHDLARDHIVQSLSQNKLHAASLRILLETCLNSNPRDILDKIASIYTLESAEEAGMLLQALYLLRSPVFTIISESFKHDLNEEMIAWTYQVEGKIDQAKQIYINSQSISDGALRNILYLAVVSEDAVFYEQFKHHYNLRTKDKGILSKIVNRAKIDKAEVNPQFAQHLKELFYDLLILRQYDVIEYFVKYVDAPMLRYELSEMLYKFEFTELALQTVTVPERSEEKVKVYVLTGDILKRLGMYGDAYNYYKQANMIDEKFDVLYKIYDLALQVDDTSIQRSSLEQMNQMRIQSIWAKNQLRSCME